MRVVGFVAVHKFFPLQMPPLRLFVAASRIHVRGLGEKLAGGLGEGKGGGVEAVRTWHLEPGWKPRTGVRAARTY